MRRVQAFEWLCKPKRKWSCPTYDAVCVIALLVQERTYDQETLVTGRLLGDPGSVKGVLLELGVFPGGMIICPRCSSRRVVLLTFPDDEPVRTNDAPRPMARCADCAHRLTAQEIASQEKPSAN